MDSIAERPPARLMVSRIFLSHSSVNNAQALAVARWLDENGWDDYFLDISADRGLSPGERWQAALKAAANRCEVVLFLISPAWRDSRWCLVEFLLAKQLGQAVFAVLIEATPLDTLPREMTGEWQLCDLVAGADRRYFRIAHDPIVPETEVSYAEAGLARLRTGLQKAGLDPSTFAWPPPTDPTRAPYRELRALEGEDAAVFLGREAAIVRGLDALRGLRERGVERMLVILGASGAGKSSFLRAGPLPRLARDDRNFLPLPVIRPERAAISGAVGLAASLESAFRARNATRSRADVRNALHVPGGLDRLLAELQALGHARLEPGAAPPTVVILIDQSEELFGPDGRSEADVFLGLLGEALAPPHGNGAEAIAAALPENLYHVWDAETWELRATIAGPEKGVTSSALSPDGRLMVITSGRTTASVWDVQTAHQKATLAGHTGRVESARFSPDGQRVVTASEDQTARVWGTGR